MTKDEREHYAKIADNGCIACYVLGYGFSACEIHHIRSGAGIGRKNHWSQAIGLCPKHHRTGGYGIAYHAGARAFSDSIGMGELDLLDKQLELIGEKRE